MSARDELDRACRSESESALVLHADAADYLNGDIPPEQFLKTALEYGKARLERERMQAELFP